MRWAEGKIVSVDLSPLYFALTLAACPTVSSDGTTEEDGDGDKILFFLR